MADDVIRFGTLPAGTRVKRLGFGFLSIAEPGREPYVFNALAAVFDEVPGRSLEAARAATSAVGGDAAPR